MKYKIYLLFFCFYSLVVQAQDFKRDNAVQIMSDAVRWSFQQAINDSDLSKIIDLEKICFEVKRGRVNSDKKYYEDCESVMKDVHGEYVFRAEKFIKKSIDKQERSKKIMCYQGLCLGDAIDKLNINSLVIERKEQFVDISAYPNILKEANKIFIAIPSAVSVLASRGYAGTGSAEKPKTTDTSKTTLDALKSIETLCNKPEKDVAVKVKSKTGREMTLVYFPMTMESNKTVYGLFGIYILYPEIKSYEEMYLLSKKIEDVTDIPLSCNNVGGGLNCVNESRMQQVDIEPTSSNSTGFVYMRLNNDPFVPSKARNHPQCRSEIDF